MANNRAEEPPESPDVLFPPLQPVKALHKELATRASLEFEHKQYGACCNTMNKLLLERSNDPKVLHNHSVVQFYQSGYQTTDELRGVLETVCRMVSCLP